MDLDEFRVILSNSKVDVWTLIDTAIQVASSDYTTELKDRRAGIVEKLFSVPIPVPCRSSAFIPNQNQVTNTNIERENTKSPDSNPHNERRRGEEEEEDPDADPYGGLFNDEQLKYSRSKTNLKIPNSLMILLLSCYKLFLIWILHFKLSRKLILEGT